VKPSCITFIFIALSPALTLSACRGTPARLATLYARAQAERREGKLAEATASVDDGIRRAVCRECEEWLWRFRLLGAEVSIERRAPAEALARVDLKFPASLEKGPLAARREKVRGKASLVLRRVDEAEKHLALASALLERAPDQHLRAELLTLQAQLFDARGRPADADALSQQGIALARSLDDSFQLAVGLNYEGWRRFSAERWAESLPPFEEAVAQARRIGSRALAAFIEVNIGICLYRLGDFEGARRRFVDASGVFERLALPELLANSRGEVGNSYILAGDPERALPYFQEALALSRGHSPGSVALWAGNVADAYVQLRRWDEAAHLNEEALSSAKLQKDEVLVRYWQMNAAHIEAGRGNLARAEAAFKELLASANTPLVLRWEADAGLGDVYARLGRVKDADRSFSNAIVRVEEARRNRTDVEHRSTTFLNGLIRLHQQYVEWLVAQKREDEAPARGRGRAHPGAVRAPRSRAAAGAPGLARPAGQGAEARRGAGLVLGGAATLLCLDHHRLGDPPGAPAGEEQLQPLVDAYRSLLETSLQDPLTLERSAGRELYRLLVAPWADVLPRDARVTIAPDGRCTRCPSPPSSSRASDPTTGSRT
jgi:tetratricopeptide (TPR) repeat protein